MFHGYLVYWSAPDAYLPRDRETEAHGEKYLNDYDRTPVKFDRAKVIRLAPDVGAIAPYLAQKIGFASGNFGKTRIGNLHELGSLTSPRQQPRPVLLFLPSLRPRPLALKESLIGVENALVLLPTENGLTNDIRNIADSRQIELRVLTADNPEEISGFSIRST